MDYYFLKRLQVKKEKLEESLGIKKQHKTETLKNVKYFSHSYRGAEEIDLNEKYENKMRNFLNYCVKFVPVVSIMAYGHGGVIAIDYNGFQKPVKNVSKEDVLKIAKKFSKFSIPTDPEFSFEVISSRICPGFSFENRECRTFATSCFDQYLVKQDTLDNTRDFHLSFCNEKGEKGSTHLKIDEIGIKAIKDL